MRPRPEPGRRGPGRSGRRARRPLVVAIDGPAGAGKTTVARGVARALGVAHIDTGAMYRALTWKALREGVGPSDGPGLAALARRTEVGYLAGGLTVDGRPVGREIRSRRVSGLVSQVSSHPGVRREFVRRQRAIARERPAVVEGRDIGTVVCRDAPVKVFLTASAAERARRRHRELLRAGVALSYRTLRRELVRRDRLDSTRSASPMAPAKDAHVVDSTGRPARDVVNEIVSLVRRTAASRGLGAGTARRRRP